MNLTLNIQYIIVLKLMEIIVESYFALLLARRQILHALCNSLSHTPRLFLRYSFSSLLISFRLSGKTKRNSEAGHGEGKLPRVFKHLLFHILQ